MTNENDSSEIIEQKLDDTFGKYFLKVKKGLKIQSQSQSQTQSQTQNQLKTHIQN